jgi:hypothetical protein
MPIHPVEADPLPPAGEPTASNPTHLPIEPEFGPLLPPGEPEDPGAQPPSI